MPYPLQGSAHAEMLVQCVLAKDLDLKFFDATKCKTFNGSAIMYAVRTSGDKSVSSLPPSSGTLLLFSFLATQWRELINFSPDVLTA